MKFKLIKSLTVGFAVGCISALSAFGQINVPSPTANFTAVTNTTTNGTYLLFTNSAKISNVQLIAGGTNYQLQMYDNNTTNTNYITSAYITRIEYATNQVSTYISPLTGTTNIQTNALWFEGNVTNGAATNQLPYRTFFAASNTLANYPVNVLISKGILFYAQTNGTVIVTYRVND